LTWVVVAVGGSALIGAGASYAGSKKQSDASKAAANLNQQQFDIINAQQQPFIQGGYGALSRINTLLGLNPRPRAASISTSLTSPAYRPTPGGGVQPIMQNGRPNMFAGGPGGDPYMNGSSRLNSVLMLRAMKGDTEAARMLQQGVG
jgi:hypothetical protein